MGPKATLNDVYKVKTVPAADQSTIHWLSSLKPSHYTEGASGYNGIHS